MMTQLSHTTTEARKEHRQDVGGHSPANDTHGRLEVLVGELLSENQRLRFENEGLRAKTAELEQRARSAENGLAEAVKWAGMMF